MAGTTRKWPSLIGIRAQQAVHSQKSHGHEAQVSVQGPAHLNTVEVPSPRVEANARTSGGHGHGATGTIQDQELLLGGAPLDPDLPRRTALRGLARARRAARVEDEEAVATDGLSRSPLERTRQPRCLANVPPEVREELALTTLNDALGLLAAASALRQRQLAERKARAVLPRQYHLLAPRRIGSAGGAGKSRLEKRLSNFVSHHEGLGTRIRAQCQQLGHGNDALALARHQQLWAEQPAAPVDGELQAGAATFRRDAVGAPGVNGERAILVRRLRLLLRTLALAADHAPDDQHQPRDRDQRQRDGHGQRPEDRLVHLVWQNHCRPHQVLLHEGDCLSLEVLGRLARSHGQGLAARLPC
mmetsp:Transcript_10217/g.26465  ORF Transcript_10217/g.26465 Transcript_10217/m.26465 type:complete len:359 (+) Transcript_10217:73-1149(+)